MENKPRLLMKKLEISYESEPLIVWAPRNMSEREIEEIMARVDFHHDFNLSQNVHAVTLFYPYDNQKVDDTLITPEGKIIYPGDFEYEPILRTEAEEAEIYGQTRLSFSHKEISLKKPTPWYERIFYPDVIFLAITAVILAYTGYFFLTMMMP